MPRTPRDTPAQIRTTATDLFLAYGYEATTLDHIAEHLNITRPAVLYHFKTKEALLRAITDPVLADIATTIAALPHHATPTRRQVTHAVTALVNVLADNRQAVALLTRFTTHATIANIGNATRDLNEKAAHALAGDGFHTDPATRVRTVSALAAIIGIMSARIPVDLTDQTQRDALTHGVVALLTR